MTEATGEGRHDGPAAVARGAAGVDAVRQAADALFRRLSRNWPAGLEARLQGECAALRRAEAGCLPYVPEDVREPALWITAAPSSQALQDAVSDLRAWVLPSLAWEHPTMPFVTPEDARGALAPLALALAPHGYFRWHASRSSLPSIADRLAAMRRLNDQRPRHALVHTPSLFELRQQFAIALLTGDQRAATGIIEAIDREGLDTALNTQLMRVALRDQFREFSATVEDTNLWLVLRSRVTPAARRAIIRAFHAVHLVNCEARGDVKKAVAAYGEHVHASIGGLLALSVATDGTEIARALAYRGALLGDRAALREIMSLVEADSDTSAIVRAALALVEAAQGSDQDPTREALSASAPPSPRASDAAGAAPAERFRAAQQAGDVVAIQTAGLMWLAAGRAVDEGPSEEARRVLLLSLHEAPNAQLRDALRVDGARIASEGRGRSVVTSTPQTWTEFSACLASREWNEARTFLTSTSRPNADSLLPAELDLLAETLDELYTAGPGQGDETGFRRVTAECTRVLVDDLVREPEFPRADRVDLYMRLLRLLGEGRRGSANVVDGHVVLTLAEAVLERAPQYESEVADLLGGWWKARPYRALLPYALEATELLAVGANAAGVAQGLWIDAVTLAGQDPAALTHGERLAWRRLARAVGFDDATADAYVQLSGFAQADDPPDVLSVLEERVAIVSLRESAARAAATEIAERTGRPVEVVTELVPGHATASAKRADVVLFVWSASKHAVFRAFDDVRERLVYVPGTGASSIVLALERWAVERG